MWLNKPLLLLSLVIPAGCEASHLAECPAYLNEKSNVLSNVDLFDGPLSDQAFLAPNTSHSDWDVSGYASTEYVISLLCHYRAGTKAVVVPKAAKICTTSGKKKMSAWCE